MAAPTATTPAPFACAAIECIPEVSSATTVILSVEPTSELLIRASISLRIQFNDNEPEPANVPAPPPAKLMLLISEEELALTLTLSAFTVALLIYALIVLSVSEPGLSGSPPI